MILCNQLFIPFTMPPSLTWLVPSPTQKQKQNEKLESEYWTAINHNSWSSWASSQWAVVQFSSPPL